MPEMTDEMREPAEPQSGGPVGPPPEIEGSLSGRGRLSAQNRAAIHSGLGRSRGSEERAVHCAGRGAKLDEPVGRPLEQREPCPSCGETARQVRITLSATVGAASGIASEEASGNVTVHATTATAIASAIPGSVVISGEFKRTLTDTKTPGGMWLALVHNADGAIVGVAVQEDSQDVLLVLEEELRPPE
jgi:hypothetical protein